MRNGSNGGVKASRGFGLVEVLAAVAVLTFGLLGIAAIQVQAKRANYEAIQRTAASTLANDIIERMRANLGDLQTYLNQGGQLGSGSIASAPSPDCSAGAPCSSYEVALRDLWEWEQALDGVQERTSGGADTGGLSAPTGCISGPGTGGTGLYRVAIAWRGQTSLANPSADDCGATTGRYDDGADANVFRRVLVVDTYIDAG